jgi:uncharacterized membrane protein YebE (DUF533 family)
MISKILTDIIVTLYSILYIPSGQKIFNINHRTMATNKNQEQPVKAKKTGKKGSTTLKVVGGVLAGAAAGAIAGVLLAPDSGKNKRKKIAEKSKKVAADVKAKVKATAKRAVDKLKSKTPVKKKK